MMPPSLKLAATTAVATGALALAGCAREFVYQPTVGTTSAIRGGPGSYTETPSESMRGHVQLTTFGFENLEPHGLEEAQERALHVRMVVENDSDATWFVDVRDQRLMLPDHGASGPALATSNGSAAPKVAVPPGRTRTIDLFYPLPDDMKDAKRVPAFDTLWRVQTDTRVVTDRTPFARLEVESRDAPEVNPHTWGPGYWYDSASGGSMFVGMRMASHYENLGQSR